MIIKQEGERIFVSFSPDDTPLCFVVAGNRFTLGPIPVDTFYHEEEIAAAKRAVSRIVTGTPEKKRGPVTFVDRSVPKERDD